MFTTEQLEQIVAFERQLLQHPSDVSLNNTIFNSLLLLMHDVAGRETITRENHPEVDQEIRQTYKEGGEWLLGDPLDIEVLRALRPQAVPHIVVRFLLAYNSVKLDPNKVPEWEAHTDIYMELIVRG